MWTCRTQWCCFHRMQSASGCAFIAIKRTSIYVSSCMQERNWTQEKWNAKASRNFFDAISICWDDGCLRCRPTTSLPIHYPLVLVPFHIMCIDFVRCTREGNSTKRIPFARNGFNESAVGNAVHRITGIEQQQNRTNVEKLGMSDWHF